MACFADVNVSQGSVATYARCCGMFSIRLAANSPRNFPAKKCVNRSKFDRIMVTSLWPRFSAHPVYDEFVVQVNESMIRSIVTDREKDYIFAEDFDILVERLDNTINRACRTETPTTAASTTASLSRPTARPPHAGAGASKKR